MIHLRLGIVVVVCLFLAQPSWCAEPPVAPASGLVVKANANVVIVRPRGPDGQFGKAMPLKVSGTSKLSQISTRNQGNQSIAVQRDVEAKDLQANQSIAVIYATLKDELVLLAAVVHPAGDK